ncbi:MAG TPA: carboxypeptidase regulatory-like domain-containing protein [Chloroflexota bacterium]|jgi:hypothetical protein
MDVVRRPQHLLASPARVSSGKSRLFAVRKLLLPPLAAALAISLSASDLASQQLGTLKGAVTTADKKPLPQAHISVVGMALTTIAASDGTFRIPAFPLGPQSVEVKLLGYKTVLATVTIESDKETDLQVVLTAVAIPLETVRVSADTFVLPEMRGFAERRARGSGTFFTRADIERMGARLFTDVLRRVPGMQIEPLDGAFGPNYSVQTLRNQGANGGRGCPVLFYMNGIPFPRMGDLAINQFVSPGEVAAVEAYTGASQIPPQFNSGIYNARCGVVVIWTRISTAASRSY